MVAVVMRVQGLQTTAEGMVVRATASTTRENALLRGMWCSFDEERPLEAPNRNTDKKSAIVNPKSAIEVNPNPPEFRMYPVDQIHFVFSDGVVTRWRFHYIHHGKATVTNHLWEDP
jgi:hypothetical protein